jgi:hypothetical protein
LFIKINFLFNQTIIEIGTHEIDWIKREIFFMQGYIFYKYYSKINIFYF